jgi:hypothetical protein
MFSLGLQVMKSVSPSYRVIAAASLLVLAVAFPAAAQDAQLPDAEGMEDGGTLAPPPPPFPDAAVISSVDDEAPALRRKPKLPTTDPFDATGLRHGGLTYYPTLEIGGVATSNVARVSSGANADVGLRLKPGLRVESTWSRHQLTAAGSAEVLRYLEEDDLSTAGADAQATLRLDARHDVRIMLESGYTLTSTGASNTEVPDTAIGNRLTHQLRASAAVEHDAAFVETRLRAGLSRVSFGDVKLSGGGVEDNEDRNYLEPTVSLRGTFNRGAVIRPFAEVAYVPRIHDKDRDRNGLARDSHGVSASLGLRIDDDPVWTGDVAVSYLVRDYEDSTLKTVHAPGLLANLQWRPTELTKVDFSATLGIEETAGAGDSGTIAWGAGATVTHAVRDNLDLIGGATLSASKNNGGTDYTFGTRAGLEWKLNPFVSWSAFYEGSWFDSAAAASDYDEQRVIASIILKR